MDRKLAEMTPTAAVILKMGLGLKTFLWQTEFTTVTLKKAKFIY